MKRILQLLMGLGLMLVWTACGPGADTVAPTVTLVSSSTSVTIASSITLSADAKDNVGVTKVEFLDGTTVLSEDTTAPYSIAVPITAAANGSKKYTAKAYDAAKNVGTSTELTVQVNIDVTPPTVTLKSSSTSVEASGDITLTAEVNDNVGVAKVEFFDGATKLGEDTSATDGFTQVVSLSVSGTFSKTYTAKASDAAGNSGTSAAVLVSVGICPTPAILDDPTCKLDKNFLLAP